MIGLEDTLSVDITDLEAGLTALAAELRQPVSKVLRERSGFFGRYLAESTFPIADVNSGSPDGGSKRAQQIGQAAVARDIGRVYVPISAMVNEIKRVLGPRVARAFVKLVNTDPAAAERLLKTSNFRGSQLSIMPWDGGALHRRSRNRRGGINRGQKPVITTDPQALKIYTRSRQKRVGFAKSGWITAISQITTIGLGQTAKWIRGQGGPGVGTDRTDRTTDPYVALGNNVGYIRRVFQERQYLRVQGSFERALAERIEVELSKIARRRNARTASANSR